jgi:formylglycine-generating enzyme required for sulfatase activity/dienelactone hydrolase
LSDSYLLVDELQGGGMSRVFLAEEVRLRRRVVIKVLPSEMSAGVSAGRFEQEIRLLAALQDPHIVPILSAGETAGGHRYYTMPFVEGESLGRRAQEGSVPLAEAIDIIRDVALALETAHRHGVIHRDIKPGNVLLTGRSAVVTDFGIAKALSDARDRTPGATLTTAGLSIGTPAYMSPEQAAGDAVDFRSDLYSWGVLAYELLGARHPFAHHTTSQALLAAHVSEAPRAIGEVNRVIPTGIQRLVMQCLEKLPPNRPRSASDVVKALDESAGASSALARKPGGLSLRTSVAVAATLVVAVIATGLFVRNARQKTWARNTAPAAIAALVDSGRFGDAFAIAQRALSLAPADSNVIDAAGLAIDSLDVTSIPSGARLYRRPYAGGDSTWQLVGLTPLEGVLVPVGSRLKLEADGYRAFETVTSRRMAVSLMKADEAGHELVPVPGGTVIAAYYITGLGHLAPEDVAPFDFGRYEVTNREFKVFVDSGGYARRELWSPGMTRDGHRVSWEQAMTAFVDVTGRPGPATWELGTFAPGTDQHPVAGVSWYEADAFARFSRRRLPTIYHWMRGATANQGDQVVPLSNVHASGPAAAGQFDGMSLFGAFDVAGNVREWTENPTGTARFILGGSFADPAYMFSHVSYLDPMDRSRTNGFRLADYAVDSAAERLRRPIEIHLRNFAEEKPASDEVFAVYRRQYDYDAAPLDAQVVSTDTTPAWIREKVTFAGPGGGERVIGYLFLPRTGAPPFQTLVFFPGAQSLIGRTPMPEGGYGNIAGEVVRTGRAFFHPIYLATYERRNASSVGTWYPNETKAYRDLIITIGKEFRRSVDYLQTRTDVVDVTRLAYFGLSWGGYLSGIMMAIEPRLRAGILLCPGLTLNRPQPEVDPFNFLPRVTIPVLMVDGPYDAIFPLEASQRPMYQAIGASEPQKRFVSVPNAGHCPSRNVFWSEALPWLERYVGPVR